MSKVNQQQPLSKQQSYGAKAWLIWGLAASCFFMDYILRVSPSVIGRDLQQTFMIGAAGLGYFSSLFYYPYVSLQLPIGLFVDRFSVRKILLFKVIITIIACVLFAGANTFMMACIARALIGFGSAFSFVCTLTLAAVWFPPTRLGLLAGLTQTLGMLGAAFGEAPISLVLPYMGWRNTQFIMALVFVVIGVLIARYVKDSPTGERHTGDKAPPQSILLSVKQLFANKQCMLNALYAGLLFAPVAVLAELWGPGFLQYGRGLDEPTAAFADGMIFIGWALGGPIIGWLSDRFSLRKPWLKLSSALSFILLCLIIYLPNLSKFHLECLFFLYGFVNTGVVIAYALSTELVSRRLVGVSIAFTNMASVIIGALFQPLVGCLIDLHSSQVITDIANLQLDDFVSAFLILPLCTLCAFFLSFFIKETHCSPLHDAK